MTDRRRTRLAAYGVCVRDVVGEGASEILLARFISRDGTRRHWTLPGGGVEHGEDPYQAVIREFAEETGYEVVVRQLLGVDARSHRLRSGLTSVDMHHVGVYYAVDIVGGDLRHEVAGSTDMAAWVPASEVPELERAVIIEVGLRLARQLPADGHVEPVPVDGLLRQ